MQMCAPARVKFLSGKSGRLRILVGRCTLQGGNLGPMLIWGWEITSRARGGLARSVDPCSPCDKKMELELEPIGNYVIFGRECESNFEIHD